MVGVVLSGTRDDGSAGLAVIKASGGKAIVQDPNDASYAGMPTSAIANVNVDAIVPAVLIGSTIASMVNGEGPPPSAGPNEPGSGRGPNPAPDPKPNPHPDPPRGGQVVAVCPECGGVLTERAEAGVLERMAQQAERRAQPRSARRFRRQSQAASEQAEVVRHALDGAAGTTLRRVVDTDDEEPAGDVEEGAA